MIESDTPRQNHLISALPAAEYERLLPHMERVKMPLGHVIYESGDALDYGYFPTTCIVSKLYITESGASSEIAVVGNDGIVGVFLFMGGATMPNRAIVRSAGEAYRVQKQFLIQEFNRSGGRRSGALQNLLLRYTQTLITQMAQTAVCNRHHSLDQQLCRWLLFSLDRLPSNELFITQEIIANMLGVRREGVTEAAGNLQRAGLIEYSRGRIKVLDRPRLEERVCECYHVVKAESSRLLLPPPPRRRGQSHARADLPPCLIWLETEGVSGNGPCRAMEARTCYIVYPSALESERRSCGSNASSLRGRRSHHEFHSKKERLHLQKSRSPRVRRRRTGF